MGRKGDTEVRDVKGRPSHVTGNEAAIIDSLGKIGESAVKKRGVGTINPATGMPEYHADSSDPWHSHNEAGSNEDPWGGMFSDQFNFGAGGTGGGGLGYIPEGGLSTEQYGTMTQEELNEYLSGEFDIGDDYDQYIRPREEQPFEFLAEARDLAYEGIGLEGDKLGLARGTAVTSGRKGMRDIYSQQGKLASQTGMASSDTVSKMMSEKRGDLMGDVGAKLSEIGLGYEALDVKKAGATLDYTSGVYEEQASQLEKLYDDIGDVTVLQEAEESAAASAAANESVGWHPAEGDWGIFDPDNTHCCTAANKHHNFSMRKVRELRVWHRRQSEIWQKG